MFRTFLIAWLLVSGLHGRIAAQSLSYSQLRAGLQNLLAQDDPTGQVGVLKKWQQDWQRGGYPPDSLYIGSLLQLGLAYHYNNNYAAAMQVVNRAIRLCQPQNTAIGSDQPAKALYRLGMLLAEQNRPAANTLYRAVERGRGIRSANRWVGGAYLYLAYEHYSVGDFQQALNSVELGERMLSPLTDNPLLTKLMQEKAKALNKLERYGAARQAAEQAVKLARQDGYPAVIARAYQLLGSIAENQRQYTDALRYYERAFAIARSIHDSSAPNYAISIGGLYDERRQYGQALQYFQFGLDNNTSDYAKAFALDRIGQVYQHRNDFARALYYYQRGLITMPIGFDDRRVTALPNPQAIQRADQKNYLLMLVQHKADAWLDYAKATRHRRYLQHALATYRVADQMVDYMRWEHVGQESKLYWRTKTRTLYERAIETCWRLGDTDEGFRFFEKSRAVMLVDKLNELGARQQLTPQQAARELALQKSVSSQQRMLTDELPGPRCDSLRAVLLGIQEKQNEFRKQIERSNPAYASYKYDTTTIPIAALKAHLSDQNTRFVSYFVGDSALFILSVSAGRDTLIQQPLGAYTRTVRACMTLLANPDAMNQTAGMRQFLALGNDLYRQLLTPLHLPDGGRVIVSPDGPFVSFEALSRSATRADYAVNRQAFSYAYSAGLLLKKRPDTAAITQFEQSSFLGVAPVQFASVLKQVPLPGSDQALKTIASRFNSPVLLMQKQASRRAFLDHTQAKVVHLFTHATANDSTDAEPRLYFADSVLNLSDLNENLLQTELVVLAACKTGVGANKQGEGVFSLARGFAAVGVPSVVTTLWNVENQATYAITTDFYRYLADGLPKDEALQQAKLNWLATTDGANQLPNYWAGLIVVGNTDPLSQATSWSWLAGGLGILLISAGGIWWWRKSRRIMPVTSWLRPV